MRLLYSFVSLSCLWQNFNSCWYFILIIDQYEIIQLGHAIICYHSCMLHLWVCMISLYKQVEENNVWSWLKELLWIQQGVGFRSSKIEWRELYVTMRFRMYLQLRWSRKLRLPSNILKIITNLQWSHCKIGRRGAFFACILFMFK